MTAKRSAPDLSYLETGEVRLAVWHWPGDGPQVLFIHATGFHSRCWDEVVNHLERFDCWAFDMRGHGLSDKPQPPYYWNKFAQDAASAAQQLGIKNAVGVGHSMGGHSVTLAATMAPTCFSSLLLIDPIILQRETYSDSTKIGHPVERRRNQWHSAQEMFDRFSDKKPFVTWNKNVLLDYCQHGLVPQGDGGGLALACPPVIEGSIYNHSTHSSADIYDSIKQLSIPVELLIPGKPEENVEPDLELYFSNGRKIVLHDQSHFIPMEVPELVADHIRNLAAITASS